eukprot:2285392-Pyramimonas_sp.AAC.1
MAAGNVSGPTRRAQPRRQWPTRPGHSCYMEAHPHSVIPCEGVREQRRSWGGCAFLRGVYKRAAAW